MHLDSLPIIKAIIIIIASTFDFEDGASLRNDEYYMHILDRLRS
jgi:hypothetical protein